MRFGPFVRCLTSFVLFGAAFATPVAVASAAAGATPSLHLSHLTVTPQRLSGVGGVVTVHAVTAGATHCRLAVTPKVARRPVVKPCTGHSVSWQVHVPHNGDAVTTRYHFVVTARGHGATVTRQRHVALDPTDQAPTIGVLATTSHIRFTGGQIHFLARTSHAKSCELQIAPTAAITPVRGSCRATRRTWSVAIPENAAETPVTYTATLVATGSHGQQVSRTATIVQKAHPPPCPGQTSTATPTTSAYFNDPSTNSLPSEQQVLDADINLICDAQLPSHGTHTEIDMAQFVFTLDDVAQALVWAHTYMHADIHLVIDGSNEYLVNPDGTHLPNVAYDDVTTNLPSGSVVVCGPNAGDTGRPTQPGDDDDAPTFPAGTGCAGQNILHTKLLAVSSVDASGEPAVLNASQNFSINAVTAAFNNGLQIVGDTSLYGLDHSYVLHLLANQQQANFAANFDTSPHAFGDATVASTFAPANSPATFPTNNKYVAANDAATDTMAKLLQTVTCDSPGALAGTHTDGTAHTSIRIAMFAYGGRDALTAAIDGLADAGCDIKIVYSSIDTGTLADLQSHGVSTAELNDATYSFPSGGSGPIFVHDKYVLISGRIGAGTATKANEDLVLAGSPNFTQKSLHSNDEAGVSYLQSATSDPDSVAIFNAYTANWSHLATIAASIPVPAPPATGQSW